MCRPHTRETPLDAGDAVFLCRKHGVEVDKVLKRGFSYAYHISLSRFTHYKSLNFGACRQGGEVIFHGNGGGRSK